MIEGILPSNAHAVETFADLLDIPLFPEEEAVIRNAVTKRRREFITVRACARSALAALGLPASPVLPGVRGAPIWPEGIVGSMTHCPGYRAAVVARADQIAAIGLDAEPHAPLPDGVLDVVADDDEREDLVRLSTTEPGTYWDRILFSAKESVYKAWFPLTSRSLDFIGATVSIEPGQGTFTARLRVPGPIVDGRLQTGFHGRWLVGNNFVMTTVTLPRDPTRKMR